MKRIRRVISTLVVGGVAWGLAACATGGDGSCGDRICDPGEDYLSCSSDCAPGVCGDGVCTAGELSSDCPQDCYCGNGTCDLGEDDAVCVEDCWVAVCGDAVCSPGETPADCAEDCFCGNATCDDGETWQDCLEDCPEPVCGDGTCEYPPEDSDTCPEDCGFVCVDAVCDLWPQCGCDAGDKCTVNANDARECLPAGATPHGQICAEDAECAAGTLCLRSSSTNLRCLQLCAEDADCPDTGGGSVCELVRLDAGGQPIAGATLCTTDCDPSSTSPPACPAGWACHLEEADHNNDQVPDYHYTDCANDAGSALHDEDCDNVTTFCAPGHFCYTTFGRCVRICRMSGSDCPAGLTCQAYPHTALVGTTEYGYCQ